jgi:hypothetical protein
MSFTNARLTAAIGGAVGDTTHVQLHTGAPGGAGTDNVATQAGGREGITFPGATDGVTADEVVFTIGAAEGPYTHITGWNQSTTGTLQWTATLSPQETFAGAGTLTVTVTATAANPT